MTLKSIEKYFARYTAPEVYPWVSEMLRDIQDEVDSGYMELPVDADGVVIHTGDEMETRCTGVTDRFTACFFAENGDTLDDETCFFDPANSRHVKPRTVEDVLRNVWEEALDYAKSDIWRNPDEVFAERADEIRELLGGDGR